MNNLKKHKSNVNDLFIGFTNSTTFQFFKKFHFFPDDIIQIINYCTLNQLYVYTMFSIMLFKIQNSLIYYNTNVLLSKFSKSFKL